MLPCRKEGSHATLSTISRDIFVRSLEQEAQRIDTKLGAQAQNLTQPQSTGWAHREVGTVCLRPIVRANRSGPEVNAVS